MDSRTYSPAAGSGSPMINYRKDAKKAVKFTFMVAGEGGTGKTTFVNCLLGRNIMPHAYEGANGATKTLSFTSANAVALPNTTLLAKNSFSAIAAADEPGIALTETTVELLDDDGVRLNLHVIDTPGFGDNLDNELCFSEIENYLKQQFDAVLAEETRIRRNPRFVDTRVHVLLYFVAPTGHGLRELDISCMKRLAKYVNVMPVVARADSFTEAELAHFKRQIRTDIAKFNVPTFQFDTFLSDYDADEDYDLIQECKYLTDLQPFAVVCSEQEFEVREGSGPAKTVRARQYPWGLVDVNNPRHSDFAVLRAVLLGSHLQDLKDLTHDFLYETYRTERLSEVTEGSRDVSSSWTAPPPSLSNLAQLAAADTSMQLDFETDEEKDLTTKKDEKDLIKTADTKKAEIENDAASVASSDHAVSLGSAKSDTSGTQDARFKRLSIAPQRSQLRQISSTVPYVIRHERIAERQHKIEQMEVESARELESRAAKLELKAAQLKAQERLLLERLQSQRKGEDDESILKGPESPRSPRTLSPAVNYVALGEE